ncbi:uncharacterized protein LOC127005021 [Eriocheir sinensis]|uniref:uncharacterized protein LOC127005021 n=1 Tax=Eriocheir sinensis TaxID=95602 RepID=UPI0021CA6FAB|nr:uncharacterized protein LOC127005021 [Eriocheir sinensis]
MENEDSTSMPRSQDTTESPNEVPETIASSNNSLDMENEGDTDSSSQNIQITEKALQEEGVSDPSPIQPASVKETNDRESEVNSRDNEESEAEVDLTLNSQPESPNSCTGRDSSDMESEDCGVMSKNTLQSPDMAGDEKVTIALTSQPQSPNSCTGRDSSDMESEDCLVSSEKTLQSPDMTRGKETTVALTSQPASPSSCTGKDSSEMESEDCGVMSEKTLHSPDMARDKETSVALTSQPKSPNSDIEKGNTVMESEECGGETVNSPDTTQGEKTDLPLSTQSDSPNPDIESSSTIMKSGDCGGIAVISPDATQGEKTDLPSPTQLNSENSLDIESERCDATLTTEHTTPSSPLEAALPSPSQSSSHDNTRMEGEGHAVTENNIRSPPLSPMETALPLPFASESSGNVDSPSTESNDCTLATHMDQNAMLSSPPEASIPTVNQEKEVEETMIPRDSSLHPSPLTPIPTTTTTQEGDSCHPEAGENKNEMKNERKVRRGIKRKTPSASKGIQTSIHLLDSNSVFRDRVVDLQMLKRESGVVCVENLQDLDVAIEEWPILLVNQLKLRDTIIESLHSVIRELVGHGQVLEQDLDYLKLKILELQQEAKKRAKENQQKTHKTPAKEAESQTTEEDLTEAWSRWYYGRWGDYYSECDPSSSSYWPGHYTQQSTVPSRAKDPMNEETQQETAEEEHEGAAEEPQAVNLEEEEKEKKNEDASHCTAKSDDTKHTEKRKKLKAKRKKERHKSEKASKEETGKESEKEEVTEKSTRRMRREERRRKARRNASGENRQIITRSRSRSTSTAVKTRLPQEDVTADTSTKEMNGKEDEKEGNEKSLGWDTSESITQQVAAVAAQAVVETGYVFQEELGLYYDYNTGYYYNAENGLYYDTKSGTYFYYDHSTQSYQFHSQVSPSDAAVTKRRKKKKADKKGKSKPSSKSEDSREKEDGELTESDKEHEDEGESESEGEREEEDVTSPECHEEEGPPAAEVPPSLRLMVVEGGERVKVGELHVVTLNGGFVGRESSNAVHLPDLNISKVHAEIEYRSSGPEDHHYFIRDVGSNNGTFVNSVRLSEARQTSSEVEVGHGWEVQFGPIKVKCHLHPGTLTCNECEPGLVLQNLPSQSGEGIASYKNAKCKEKARRKELKAMQKKYKLTHREAQAASSVVAPGYTDRTLLRQAQKGSDNPYEKTEVASAEEPLKETNRGFTLLQKMGWSKGQGLGKDNTGRKDPIHQVSVVGKAGLGSSQPTAPPPPDPWATRRKKQLQITQERFNQH